MLNKFISSILLFTLASHAWGASLQANGNGTVTDFDTGLIWQQQNDNAKRSWNAANTYCNGLTLGGQSDWRLPLIKELTSIVDYRVNNPSIDDAKFPTTTSSNYWSASSFASNDDNAWNVRFNDGVLSVDSKTANAGVRCVR